MQALERARVPAQVPGPAQEPVQARGSASDSESAQASAVPAEAQVPVSVSVSVMVWAPALGRAVPGQAPVETEALAAARFAAAGRRARGQPSA